MNKLPFITAVFRINNSTVHRGAIVLVSIYILSALTVFLMGTQPQNSGVGSI